MLWLLNKLDRKFLAFLGSYEYWKYEWNFDRNAYRDGRERRAANLLYAMYKKSEKDKKSTFLELFE